MEMRIRLSWIACAGAVLSILAAAGMYLAVGAREHDVEADMARVQTYWVDRGRARTSKSDSEFFDWQTRHPLPRPRAALE